MAVKKRMVVKRRMEMTTTEEWNGMKIFQA